MLYPKPSKRRRPRPERTPASEAEYVLRRDGECVVHKLTVRGEIPPGHACEGRLTIEHLYRFAGRRVHGRRYMVAACLHANVDGECSKWRDKLRDYVATVEAQ